MRTFLISGLICLCLIGEVFADIPATAFYVVRTDQLKKLIPKDRNLADLDLLKVEDTSVAKGYFEGDCNFFLKTDDYQYRFRARRTAAGTGTVTAADITFSREGIGSARRVAEAIRIKPGCERNIYFIKGNAKKCVPKYYENGIEYSPNGKVDIPKGKDYIPLDKLQYFDKETHRWVDFCKASAQPSPSTTDAGTRGDEHKSCYRDEQKQDDHLVFSFRMFSQEDRKSVFSCSGEVKLKEHFSVKQDWQKEEYVVLFRRENLSR